MNEEVRDGESAPDGETSRTLVGYFRDCPDRFFAILGSVVFFAGWAAVIYLAFFSDYGPTGGGSDVFRIQLMVGLGASVTSASAILWGIAAYLWVHLLPDTPGT